MRVRWFERSNPVRNAGHALYAPTVIQYRPGPMQGDLVSIDFDPRYSGKGGLPPY